MRATVIRSTDREFAGLQSAALLEKIYVAGFMENYASLS